MLASSCMREMRMGIIKVASGAQVAGGLASTSKRRKFGRPQRGFNPGSTIPNIVRDLKPLLIMHIRQRGIAMLPASFCE